eukprot:g468.t1
MPRRRKNDYEAIDDDLVYKQYETLHITSHVNGLDVLTLNRPPMNPLSRQMFLELAHYFFRLRTDFSVRVVILRAEGKSFSAGLDLKESTSKQEDAIIGEDAETGENDEPPVFEGQRRVSDLPKYMRSCPQPIICCVQGAAAGGGFGLALASDVRYCTPDARFNVAMIRIGLSGLDVGISYHLPRLVGASTASEFILTGRFMGADRAYRCGLVSEIFPSQQEMDAAAIQLAGDMLANSAMGLRYTKEGLNQNVDAPSLEAALGVEDRTQVLISQANAKDITKRMKSFVSPNRSRALKREGVPKRSRL